MSVLEDISAMSCLSEDILYGKEMIRRDSVDDHALNLSWHLRNFSKLPKYIFSNNYSMALGCKLMWRIDIAFSRSEMFEKHLNLSAKLHRVDCEIGTVRGKFRILLQDNNDELLHDGLCSSVFSSESLICPSSMFVKLKNPRFGSLIGDELSLRIDLETDGCCSVVTPAQQCHNRLSAKSHPSLRRTTLIEDLETAYVIGLMADVILKAGEDSIRAHKFILCARSPVLRKALENDFRANISFDLDPTGKFTIACRPFIYYLYTGLLDDMSTDVACLLYSMANKYEVRPLQMTCGHVLLSRIDTRNVCRIFSLAHFCNDIFLKDFAARFIYAHYTDITKSADWGRLIEGNSVLHAEVKEFCVTHTF